MSHTDRGNRILGMALIQGKIGWELLVEALVREGQVPVTGEEALRRLLEDGVLSPADVAGLESTEGALTPLPHLPDEATQPPPPSATTPEAARLLTALAIPQWRQYRNLRFVGEGGMGRIYKGFDGTLRRMVALKFLRRCEPHLIARFMQEAQLQGGLEHPNICRVYEVGDWQGQAYIAMQFIRGESLDVCAEKLSLREKVLVMESVASAMHHAHRQGLIHRDLKPANIMVERLEGQDPHPFVLDFGLARGLEPSGFTQAGQVVGTYHFMAPEQARGSQDLDRRTDVYALGATLYAILGDRPPFWEVEGVEVLHRTLTQEPTPIGQLVPGLPPDLETIAMKCLEKEPVRRYESARALAEDLRRFLDDEPILARRPTLTYRAAKFARRHRALVAVSGVALAAVLTFGTVAAVSWTTARTRARHAQAYGQEAERLEAWARYIHLLPPHDIRGERAALRARMERLAAQAATKGRLARGPAAYALGRGHMALGLVEEAHRRFQEALALGFDGPDLRFALGRAQGALYQKAMDEARRIGDASLRRAEEARAQKEWLKPAQANLKLGAGTALHGAAFEQALLDFYDRRLEPALAKAREAYAQTPWFYEARRLEADILHAKAMEDREADRAMATLFQVADLLRDARRIAPSDPGLALGIAEAWRDHLLRAATVGKDQPAMLEACEAAAREALALDPGSAEVETTRAYAYNYAAYGKVLRRDPNEAEIQAGLERAEAALRLDPNHFGALKVQLSLMGRAAFAAIEDERKAPSLDRLRAVANRALALRPGDPSITSTLGSTLRFRFTILSQKGGDALPLFEEARSVLETALRQHPDVAALHQSLASLWLERAEHERIHGRVPEEAVQHTIRAAEACLALEPSHPQSQGTCGSAHLVLAEAQAAAGLDPRTALKSATERNRAVLLRNPSSYEELMGEAEVALIRAEYLQASGQDAGTVLREVRQHLSRVTEHGRSDALFLTFRADLVEASGGAPGSRAALERCRRLLPEVMGVARQKPMKYLAILGRYHRLAWTVERRAEERQALEACIRQLSHLDASHPALKRLAEALPSKP